MSFNKLPVEIVMEIFSYQSQSFLYRVIKNVCKSWEAIALLPKFWKSVNLKTLYQSYCFSLDDSKNKEMYEFVAKMAEHIVEFTCEYYIPLDYSETRESFTDFLERVEFPKLEVLSVELYNSCTFYHESEAEINLERLDEIISHFSTLRRLEMTSWNHFMECGKEKTQHLRNLPSLRYNLYISLYEEKYDVPTEAFEQKVLHLNHRLIQTLDHFPNLTEFDGFSILRDESLVNLLKRCPSLENLDLYNFDDLDFLEVDDIDTLPSFERLSTLHLGSTSLRNFAIEMITRRTPNLVHLNISSTDYISDQGIVVIANNCPRLESFNVGKDINLPPDEGIITNMGLKAIANGCPNLKLVDFQNCNLIDDKGVFALALSCPKLEHVELSGTCITDAGVQTLVLMCKNITRMFLDECLKITNWAVKFIIENSPLLDILSLKNCTTLNCFDFDMESINSQGSHRGHSRLRKLNMNKCVSINNVCLRKLGKACADLKRVDLTDTNVSDLGVQLLLQQCPLLTHLEIRAKYVDTQQDIDVLCNELYKTSQITNRVCLSIVQFGQSLIHVDLINNFNLEKQGLFILLTKCVALRTIYLSVLKQGLEGKLVGLTIQDCKLLVDEINDVISKQTPARETRLCKRGLDSEPEVWDENCGESVSLNISIDKYSKNIEARYRFLDLPPIFELDYLK